MRTAVNAISHGLPMTLQVGVLRMQPADACPCREPATATLTESHAARSLLEPAETIAPSAIIAGPLTIPHNGTPLKPCADARLRRKSKSLYMAALALTHMTCFAAQTAMTAASPGPPMTSKSGTLRTWFAAAKLKTSERLFSPRPATPSTLANAVPTAENATCLGRLTTLYQLEIAGADAPGETNLTTHASSKMLCMTYNLAQIFRHKA